MAADSLRSAWDMMRAWSPMWESPISPSISALGTSAATLSITTTSHGATSDQVLGYLQRLLRGIRLGDEEFCQINPKVAGVGSVHRVLGIDIGSSPTRLLGLRHDVLSQCGLAGGTRRRRSP